VEEALKHRDGTPTFAVDSAPWLAGVLKGLGLRYNVESFRRWRLNRVRIFILQARTKASFSNINSNPLSRSERSRRFPSLT
jgi:hypothetical protein